MTKKLWTADVAISFEMAIWAETEDEARKLAKKHAPEELENIGGAGDFDIGISDTPPGPDLNDALPWGDFGGEREKTVGALKKELGVEHPMEERMRKLSEAIRARADFCDSEEP